MGAEQLLRPRKRQTAADLKSELRRHLREHPAMTYAELLDDAWDFRVMAGPVGPTKDKDVEWRSWDVPEMCRRVMLEPQALALLNAPDLATAMSILERVAGHFTLLKFSTGWKAVFETPWLGEHDQYENMLGIPTADTPLAAIRLAAARELSEQNSEVKVDFRNSMV